LKDKEANDMETDYPGIDYSLGKANRNLETGFHYGIISQLEVLQVWADNSEAFYGEIECECGHIFNTEKTWTCPNCENEDFDFLEPRSFYFEDKEYSAECDDHGDIMITKSPYYTTCQFCSPCAPGAGYLMETCETGPKTYCFGHDWFENDIAPYPVYSVETGKQIFPDKEA